MMNVIMETLSTYIVIVIVFISNYTLCTIYDTVLQWLGIGYKAI